MGAGGTSWRWACGGHWSLSPLPFLPLFLLPHLRIHSRWWERASALQPHLLLTAVPESEAGVSGGVRRESGLAPGPAVIYAGLAVQAPTRRCWKGTGSIEKGLINGPRKSKESLTEGRRIPQVEA